MPTVEDRVRALVDDRLFKAFWEGAAHFGTRDLVMFFDESDEEPVNISPRLPLLAEAGLPENLRSKIQKPASEAAVQLKGADTAFWLMAMFADGKAACVAINAKPLARGGTA
jgi:hypothetical protein